LDAAAKKEILRLLFKKIIVKNLRNARARARVSPVLFEPFEKIHTKHQFLLKEREKCQSIILKHTAVPWAEIYHKLKSVLEFLYRDRI
jgi:hypothetical protein